MLKIFLLGQFKLEKNGQRLSLRSRRAQSLIAYLMMHRGARLRRELIAGLLWPDLTDEKARTRLRYAIWQLRKAIGEEYLSVDKIEMAFNAESDYWIDIDCIDRIRLLDRY
jgi:DNA-binding SARP family transcriptional activator